MIHSTRYTTKKAAIASHEQIDQRTLAITLSGRIFLWRVGTLGGETDVELYRQSFVMQQLSVFVFEGIRLPRRNNHWRL